MYNTPMNKVWLIFLLIFPISMQSNLLAKTKSEIATFAGGCFWCMEPAFEGLQGVEDVIAGYTGGDKENPTYEEVSTGRRYCINSASLRFIPKEDLEKEGYAEYKKIFQ